jgi:hypothetical protein
LGCIERIFFSFGKRCGLEGEDVGRRKRWRIWRRERRRKRIRRRERG